MTPLELLLSKLPGVKKLSSGWSARCPATLHPPVNGDTILRFLRTKCRFATKAAQKAARPRALTHQRT